MSNKNAALTATALVLILGQFALLVYYFELVYNSESVAQLQHSPGFQRAGRALHVMVVTTDIYLAGVLVILLHRGRCGSQRTDSVINKLIFYTISTGLTTGLIGIAAVITELLLSDSLFYYIFDPLIPSCESCLFLI